jgi:predicted DNA-binding transcriptional regulator YafY
MPQNKNAIERYLFIDKLFQRGRKWTKDEILDKFQEKWETPPGERTLEKDFSDMRSNSHLNYNAPIKYFTSERKYGYSRRFSIRSLPLTDKDKENLALASTILTRYSGFDELGRLSKDVMDIAMKLNAAVGNDNAINKYIEFDRASHEGGVRHLADVFNAIKDERPLRIKHKKNNSQEFKTYDIHPYRLKEYQKRWYVLALDDAPKTLKVFGLDRTEYIERLENFALVPPPDNIANYFDDIVGINKPNGMLIQEILVKCTNFKGRYFQSQPLHKSQQLIEKTADGETMTFCYTLIPNEEFKGEVEKWGVDVKIV